MKHSWIGLGILIANVWACGGSVAPPEQPEFGDMAEGEDPSALASCHPECVSADWYNSDARLVIYEVSRCSKQPVFAPQSVARTVSVSFFNETCSQALAAVAQALGLTIARAVDGDSRIPKGAYVFRFRDGSGQLVDAKTFAPGLENAGEALGQVGSSDPAEANATDGANKRPREEGVSHCGGYGQPSCNYGDPTGDCNQRCGATHNQCYPRCSYGRNEDQERCRRACWDSNRECRDECSSR